MALQDHRNDPEEEWLIEKDGQEYDWTVLPSTDLAALLAEVQIQADRIYTGEDRIKIVGLIYKEIGNDKPSMLNDRTIIRLYAEDHEEPVRLKVVSRPVKTATTTTISNVPPIQDEKSDFDIDPVVLFNEAYKCGRIKNSQLIPKSEWSRWNMKKVNWKLMTQPGGDYQRLSRDEKGVDSLVQLCKTRHNLSKFCKILHNFSDR